jgi:hypothetical protein
MMTIILINMPLIMVTILVILIAYIIIVNDSTISKEKSARRLKRKISHRHAH